MRFLFILLSLLYIYRIEATSYYGTIPEGWYWGRVKEEPKPQKPQERPPTAQQTLTIVQSALNEAKAEAVLHPTSKNIYNYLVLQHWVASQSKTFSTVAMDVVADHPELNAEIQNPSNNAIRQVQLQTENQSKEVRAKDWAKTIGFIFFYRGGDALDEAETKSVIQFSKTYGFALIGVSVDGKVIEGLNNRPDEGRSNKLGVKAFPALVAINPKTQENKVIFYGYPSQTEMLDSLNKRLSITEEVYNEKP